TYVNRKATGGNIAYGLNQTVSPRFPQALFVKMLTGDNTMTEVGQVIDQIEAERDEVEGPRLDALIATSLISHGVDLERINFLCMVGMSEMRRAKSQVLFRYTPKSIFRYNETNGWCEVSS